MARYQQARDQRVLPMYEFTCDLARLEPPAPELQRLLGAVQTSQAAMDQFVSVIAGTAPVREFFDPRTLSASWPARQLCPDIDVLEAAVQNRINGLAEAVARSFKMHRPGREFSAASRYASGDQLTCCLVTPGRRPLRPDRSTSVGRVTVIAPERREALHRRALRLEYLTVGWNVLEAVVAIGAGVLAGSVALIAFGADSGIEIVSAVGLLWRLRKAGPYAPVGEESEAEKRALYVVAVTFFLLAVYIYEGLTGLFNSEEPLTSPIGIALSLSSLVIMPILAYAKQRTGKQMGSRALVADSKETWVCSYLSLALLIGVGAYALRLVVGFAGALVMLPVIVWQGWKP